MHVSRRKDDAERHKITNLLLINLKQKCFVIIEDNYHLNKTVSCQSLQNNALRQYKARRTRNDEKLDPAGNTLET